MDFLDFIKKDYIFFTILLVSLFLIYRAVRAYISRMEFKSKSSAEIRAMEREINDFEIKRMRMGDRIKELRLEERDLTLDIDKISKMLTQLEAQRNRIVDENNRLISKYSDEIEKIRAEFKEEANRRLEINKRLKSQYDLLIMKKTEASKERLCVIQENKEIIKAGEKARKTINLINKRYLELKNKDSFANIKSLESSYNYYNSNQIDEKIAKIIQYQMEMVESGDAFEISDYEILDEDEFDKSRRIMLTSVNILKMINYEFGVILSNANESNLDELVKMTNNLFDKIESDFSFNSIVYIKIHNRFKKSKIDELNIFSKMNTDIG